MREGAKGSVVHVPSTTYLYSKTPGAGKPTSSSAKRGASRRAGAEKAAPKNGEGGGAGGGEEDEDDSDGDGGIGDDGDDADAHHEAGEAGGE